MARNLGLDPTSPTNTARQTGWGRLPPEMGDVKGSFQALLAPQIKLLRLYDRSLRTKEAVANFRAGAL